MLKKILGNKKLIADVILIASVLILTLSVLLIVNFTRKPGSLVRVTVKGDVIAEYPLSVDCEYVINGGTNILVVKDGKAYLRYSECPDKTCVFGNGVFGNKISMNGERIDCLPNFVRIEIVGDGESIVGG
jgi:hypothetical protein